MHGLCCGVDVVARAECALEGEDMVLGLPPALSLARPTWDCLPAGLVRAAFLVSMWRLELAQGEATVDFMGQ